MLVVVVGHGGWIDSNSDFAIHSLKSIGVLKRILYDFLRQTTSWGAPYPSLLLR